MRVEPVAFQAEVVVVEAKDIRDVRVDIHRRQRIRRARELFVGLLDMIGVDMRIAKRVDELSRLETCRLCHHHREQGIGGDVERHTKEDIRTALVELAGEVAFQHVELEKTVAGRQRHIFDFSRVPGGDDQASRIGVRFYLPKNVRNLVDRPAIGCRPRAPLRAVNRAEIAVFVRPFVPDFDAVSFRYAMLVSPRRNQRSS